MQSSNLYPVDCILFEGWGWVLCFCIPKPRRPSTYAYQRTSKSEGYGTSFPALLVMLIIAGVWKCGDFWNNLIGPVIPNPSSLSSRMKSQAERRQSLVSQGVCGSQRVLVWPSGTGTVEPCGSPAGTGILGCPRQTAWGGEPWDQ